MMGAMNEIRINRIALAGAMEERGVGIVSLARKMGTCPSRIDAAMRVAHALGLRLADLLILEDGRVRKDL